MTLRIQAVTFDLDGVLVDSETINVRSAFVAFAERGYRLVESDVAEIVGRHPVDYLAGLGRRFGLDEGALDALRARQGEIYHELWDEHARPVDGADDALAAVERAGLPAGLATSGGREHVTRCLERFGLGGTFRFVLTKDDVERRKPHPEVYLKAAAAAGVAPEAMLVVEDSEYGVRAALAAGAVCVAVRNGHTPPERLEGAVRILDGVGELPALLA